MSGSPVQCSSCGGFKDSGHRCPTGQDGLVYRLRKEAKLSGRELSEAADEIERQRVEIEQLQNVSQNADMLLRVMAEFDEHPAIWNENIALLERSLEACETTKDQCQHTDQVKAEGQPSQCSKCGLTLDHFVCKTGKDESYG